MVDHQVERDREIALKKAEVDQKESELDALKAQKKAAFESIATVVDAKLKEATDAANGYRETQQMREMKMKVEKEKKVKQRQFDLEEEKEEEEEEKREKKIIIPNPAVARTEEFLKQYDAQRAVEKAEFGTKSNSDYSYEKLLAREQAKMAHTKELRDRQFYNNKPGHFSEAEWYTYNMPAHHLKNVPYNYVVQTGEDMQMKHKKEGEKTKDSIDDVDEWAPDAAEKKFEKEVADEENPDAGSFNHMANAYDSDPRHDTTEGKDAKKDAKVAAQFHQEANESYKANEVTSESTGHKKHHKQHDGEAILKHQVAVVDGKPEKNTDGEADKVAKQAMQEKNDGPAAKAGPVEEEAPKKHHAQKNDAPKEDEAPKAKAHSQKAAANDDDEITLAPLGNEDENVQESDDSESDNESDSEVQEAKQFLAQKRKAAAQAEESSDSDDDSSDSD